MSNFIMNYYYILTFFEHSKCLVLPKELIKLRKEGTTDQFLKLPEEMGNKHENNVKTCIA